MLISEARGKAVLQQGERRVAHQTSKFQKWLFISGVARVPVIDGFRKMPLNATAPTRDIQAGTQQKQDTGVTSPSKTRVRRAPFEKAAGKCFFQHQCG